MPFYEHKDNYNGANGPISAARVHSARLHCISIRETRANLGRQAASTIEAGTHRPSVTLALDPILELGGESYRLSRAPIRTNCTLRVSHGRKPPQLIQELHDRNHALIFSCQFCLRFDARTDASGADELGNCNGPSPRHKGPRPFPIAFTRPRRQQGYTVTGLELRSDTRDSQIHTAINRRFPASGCMPGKRRNVFDLSDNQDARLRRSSPHS